MKKGAALVAVLAVALFALPAAAQLQAGINEGGFDDWGSFFSTANGPTTATPNPVLYWDASVGTTGTVINAPSVGDLDRTVLKVQTLVLQGEANPYYSSSEILGEPQIIGLVYDLEITDVRFLNVAANGLKTPVANDGTNDIHLVQVDLGDGSRWDEEGYTGGRADFWVDPTHDFSASGSSTGPSSWSAVADPDAVSPDFLPDEWFLAGNHDSFPTVDDGTALPFFSGTLAAAAGDPLLTFDLWVQDDPSAANFAGSGSSGLGFIDILSNQSGSVFLSNFLGGLAEIQFQNTFTFWPDHQGATISGKLSEPEFDDPTTTAVWWDTKSDDPAFFAIAPIPEPTTLALLATGVAGLVGIVRRRRK